MADICAHDIQIHCGTGLENASLDFGTLFECQEVLRTIQTLIWLSVFANGGVAVLVFAFSWIKRSETCFRIYNCKTGTDKNLLNSIFAVWNVVVGSSWSREVYGSRFTGLQNQSCIVVLWTVQNCFKPLYAYKLDLPSSLDIITFRKRCSIAFPIRTIFDWFLLYVCSNLCLVKVWRKWNTERT